MPEILHSQLTDFLKKPTAAGIAPVCLIHGEQVLVEQCLQALIVHLLAGASGEIHCETLDGLAENIPDALERVNTYAMVAGPRVVVFKDAKLFDTGSGGHQRLVDQIREAFEAADMSRAGKMFAQLCGRLGLEAAGLGRTGVWPTELQPLCDAVGEDGLSRLIEHCGTREGVDTAALDYLQILTQAIEKGFPSGHHLVIAANTKVPKNRRFYKIVQSIGLIVDCHVPLGERKADKGAQDLVLKGIMDAALKKAGKRMQPGLFGKLQQLTGFDPLTFRGNIEKLIDFCGKRDEITATDVDAVLRRTKSDPLYELTNAVAERNTSAALFFADTLLNADWHPLQIVAALANQVRKLLVAGDFAASDLGRAWNPGMAYPHFQQSVLPAIQAFDARIAALQESRRVSGAPDDGTEKKRAGKGAAEFALVSNPANAYPVFQTMIKSRNFTCEELIQILERLSETDIRLKSTGQNAALVIRTTVISICAVKQSGLRAGQAVCC
jgi:DNA polymerase III subunit delta